MPRAEPIFRGGGEFVPGRGADVPGTFLGTVAVHGGGVPRGRVEVVCRELRLRCADDPAGALVFLAPRAADPTGELRVVRAAGAAAVIGVLSGSRGDARAALLEAGAVAVISPRASRSEWIAVARQAVERIDLARRHASRARELIVLSSIARRIAADPLRPGLPEDLLASLGRVLDLEEGEILVLDSPWRTEGACAFRLAWDPARGPRRLPGGRLDDLDVEVIRGRRPVRGEGPAGEGLVAVPLVCRDRAAAVFRARRSSRGWSEDDLRILYDAGALLGGVVAALGEHDREGGRHRAEMAEQQALFQAVVDALPLSLHAIDRAFRVVVWNRNREEGPFGRPRGEVLGKNLFSIIGEDEELRREYEDVFRTGEPRVTEVEGRASNPPRIYRVEKVPIHGPDGAVTHVITFSRDVTEQRALERSIARTEKMAAVGRLAAGIAHEINNPLATIAGCAEAMRARLREPLDPEGLAEIREDAGVIEEEAYRCKEILEGLLDFSRARAERKGACDPREIARRAVRLLRHNPKASGVRLELDLAGEVPEVLGGEDQLVQVVLALVLNAADAAGPGGKVTVRVGTTPGGEVVLAVEDDGPGIPPEIRERIFEPFFTTKPPGKGTGLGLAVAYGIVRAHGGRIEVMSHPGLGTRFEIVLPPRERGDEPVGAGVAADGKRRDRRNGGDA